MSEDPRKAESHEPQSAEGKPRNSVASALRPRRIISALNPYTFLRDSIRSNITQAPHLDIRAILKVYRDSLSPPADGYPIDAIPDERRAQLARNAGLVWLVGLLIGLVGLISMLRGLAYSGFTMFSFLLSGALVFAIGGGMLTRAAVDRWKLKGETNITMTAILSHPRLVLPFTPEDMASYAPAVWGIGGGMLVYWGTAALADLITLSAIRFTQENLSALLIEAVVAVAAMGICRRAAAARAGRPSDARLEDLGAAERWLASVYPWLREQPMPMGAIRETMLAGGLSFMASFLAWLLLMRDLPRALGGT